MAEARTEHSGLGIASFVLSIVPAVLLAGLVPLVLLLASMQPPGADETGYAGLMLLLVLMTALSELVALGLGIAGVIQGQRKRTFALVGLACSVLVLAVIHSGVGLGRLAIGIPELMDPPKVHSVSPGNE